MSRAGGREPAGLRQRRTGDGALDQRLHAERLADLWIREATEIKNVKRKDIVRPAYLYFAFKQLLRKYDAAAITYDSATLTLRPQKVKAWTPLVIPMMLAPHDRYKWDSARVLKAGPSMQT